MYERQTLTYAEAQAGMQAIYEQVSKEVAENPNLPTVAAAVVDDHGDVIALMRMEKAPPLLATEMAIKKAYTAVKMQRDTGAWGKVLQGLGLTPSDFSNDMTRIPGGVIITKPGVERGRKPGERGPEVYGGIGVSARPADNDEALAFVGLRAIQKACWGKSD